MRQQADIIEGLRKGDRKVLNHIYSSYFERLQSWVVNNRGDQQAAEDLFQDGLTVIYIKLRDPGFAIEHQFYTYLFSICRNLWLKKLRDDRVLGKSNVMEEGLQLVDTEGDEEVLDLKKQIFRRKFAKLGKNCQEIIRLALQGKTPMEIASALKLKSERHATNRKSYCKQQLAELVREDPMYSDLLT